MESVTYTSGQPYVPFNHPAHTSNPQHITLPHSALKAAIPSPQSSDAPPDARLRDFFPLVPCAWHISPKNTSIAFLALMMVDEGIFSFLRCTIRDA